MAELLGMPEKIEWKACALSKEEETLLVDHLKEAFAPYDPTLEE
jgi:hypothetical protein